MKVGVLTNRDCTYVRVVELDENDRPVEPIGDLEFEIGELPLELKFRGHEGWIEPQDTRLPNGT